MEHALKKLPMRLTLVCLALALVAGNSIFSALAHSGATGVTKERMDLMKGMAMPFGC